MTLSSLAFGRVLALVLLTTAAASAQGTRGTPTPTAGGTAQGARSGAPPEARQEIGPLEKKANPVTPENPIPRRIFSQAPLYPGEASGTGLLAGATLKLTLDQSGRVAEARTTSLSYSGTASPQAQAAFQKAALDSVRQWIYDPPASPPISLYVQVNFFPDSESRITWHDAAAPTARNTFTAAPPPPPPPPGSAAANAVRVGGNIAAPRKIKDVQPVYPAIAQSARVSGIVIVEATIGADGRVVDARVLRSIPLLDLAALDAVRQWEFTPTLLNGVPTPIIMSVTVNFQLQLDN
jgi:protein TonB